MNAILLLVTIFFTSMAITSCTTKEGEDLDVLTPEDEDQLGREQL